MPQRIRYGDYHLIGRLNTGGMAEVFLGRHVDADPESELLAVKRMLPRYSQDPEFSTMFTDEARIAERLNHPNICRVVDDGQHQEQLFIVMEFVHGKDMKVVHLRARERGERVPYSLVAFVVSKIAEALDYAHDLRNSDGELENLVHRDVSPQNILVSYDGIPKLIDFGVARAKSKVAQTKVGIVKGKFAYMSPEQATAKPLDGRSDLWALGVVLYQLLTGELPFKGSSDIDMLRRIASGNFIPIREVAPDAPPALIDIIERCMQKDVSLRYQRGKEFAKDCQEFIRRSDRVVDERLLAAYMQHLFEREYRREVERIKEYQAGADAASLRQPKSVSADDPEPSDTEVLSLAAGYQPRDSDVSDVVEFEVGNTDSISVPTHPTPFADSTDENRQPDGISQTDAVSVSPVPTAIDDELTQKAREGMFDERTIAMTPGVRRRVPAPPPQVMELSHPPLLSRSQVRVLIAAAMLGALSVGGTCIYANSIPLESIGVPQNR